MRPFDELGAFDQILRLALTDPEAAQQRLRLLRPGGGSETQVRVYYGPPGTGKTVIAVREAVRLADPTFPAEADLTEAFARLNQLRDRIAFVTFHQSLQYEDMVEAIRPVVLDEGALKGGEFDEEHEGEEEVPEDAGDPEVGQLLYRRWEGPFLRLIRSAIGDPTNEFVIIVDEINRGDVSRILGPLISAIEPDKRADSHFPLGFEALYPRDPLQESRIFVPSNLHIIGTMNSADRNIALVDYALRRRFEFIAVPPQPALLEGFAGGLDLVALFHAINRRISFLLDADHRIGHGYFMRCGTDEDVVRAMATKVIPLLHEYFYGSEAEVLLVLGEGRPDTPNIHTVLREEAGFQELFGRSAAEAAGMGYQASARRMVLELAPEFWDTSEPVGRAGNLTHAIAAIRAVYEAGEPAVAAGQALIGIEYDHHPGPAPQPEAGVSSTDEAESEPAPQGSSQPGATPES